MKVAAIQYKPAKGDGVGAWRKLEALITKACVEGAQLVVCPEMAVSGYLFENAAAAARIAEAKEGPGFARLAELATRHGVHIVCGYAEIDAQPGQAARLYNSARVVGPDGRLLYNYRKRLLFDSDTTWADPGDTAYPLIRLPTAWLSVGICMDLNDDRFTRFLRQKRPHLIAFCTNWLDEGEAVLPYWRYRLDGVSGHFIAANTYGEESEPGHPLTRFCGRSAILAPGGELLLQGPYEGDAVLVTELPARESSGPASGASGRSPTGT